MYTENDNKEEIFYDDEQMDEMIAWNGHVIRVTGKRAMSPRTHYIAGTIEYSEYDSKDQLLIITGYFRRVKNKLNIEIPATLQIMVKSYWDKSKIEKQTINTYH